MHVSGPNSETALTYSRCVEYSGNATGREWFPSVDSCNSLASSEDDSNEEVQADPPTKKKNPYSIEELLKKTPDTKIPKIPSTIQTLFFAYPPCGLLIDKGCTCKLVQTGYEHNTLSHV